jgi:hypothetical protein
VSAHLDDTTFEQLAMRELDAAARARALAHVTACPRCAAIHRTLLDVEAGAREAKLAGVPALRPPRRRWAWVGAAATMAAAAVLVVWFARGREEVPVVRGGSGALTLGTTGELRAPIELTWERTTAARYRVSVFDDLANLVWTREVAGPPVRWPADVAARPERYRWKVEALDGTTVIEESRLGSFRIVP